AVEERPPRAHAVAELRGALELLGFGRLLHALLELPLDRAVAARQEADDRLDVPAVLLFRDVADAGRLAALDVVVQAGAARRAPGLGTVARPVREELAEQVERLAHALGVREGTEVGPLGAMALAREVDARKALVERDPDVGIRLVVAQPDVVRRPVLLDEVLLREQRLGFVGGRDEVDRLDLSQELVGGAGRLAREMRRDPLSDRLRLPDVERATVGVLEEIDAGRIRQRAALLEQAVLAGGHALPSLGGGAGR